MKNKLCACNGKLDLVDPGFHIPAELSADPFMPSDGVVHGFQNVHIGMIENLPFQKSRLLHHLRHKIFFLKTFQFSQKIIIKLPLP